MIFNKEQKGIKAYIFLYKIFSITGFFSEKLDVVLFAYNKVI